MNWLRRNWVDALMGALIVTVVGGVLVLLLRGGGTPNNAASPTSPNPATSPVAPTPPQTSSTPPVTPPAPSGTNPPAPQTTPPTSAQSAQKPLEVPAIPSVGEAAPAPTPVAAQLKPSPVAAPVQTTMRPTVARNGSAASPAEPRAYNRADFLKNYRVAVGTYSNATRSQSAAQKLRASGYPAQAFSSGGAFIVVVGPYARESSARAAFNKLRTQGFPDAVLYAPNGKRERGAPTGQTPAIGERNLLAAEEAAASSKPAATGGAGSSPAKLDPGYLSYLQVGAFKDTKSALPLLEQLKGSGFKALLRAAMDGYVRVLVGPYDNSSIEAAKESLKGQGLTPFAVQQ
jgi:cell division septation protein DedD